MPEAKPKTMNIYQKMLAVSAAVDRVPKTGRNEFHKYDYATEADILDAVRGHLVDNGLVVYPSIKSLKTSEIEGVDRDGRIRKQQMRRAEMRFTIINADNPEETIEIVFWGEGLDAGDKGIYKAYTGGEKYFLTKTFMIPTGDDPEREGEAAETEDHGLSRATPEANAAPPLVDNPFLPPEEVIKIREAWDRNEALDKKRALPDYLADITEMLWKMNDGDVSRAADILFNYSSFQSDDGKVVPGKRDITKFSYKWARSTCHKLEKDYEKWQKNNPEVSPEEVDAYFARGGEVP